LSEQKVRPGEIVPIEIEVLASSTLFEPQSSLRLDILGTDPARYPAFKHGHSINRGRHFIHTGRGYDSHLLVPFPASQ
jgi:predicted acyl esterase